MPKGKFIQDPAPRPMTPTEEALFKESILLAKLIATQQEIIDHINSKDNEERK